MKRFISQMDLLFLQQSPDDRPNPSLQPQTPRVLTCPTRRSISHQHSAAAGAVSQRPNWRGPIPSLPAVGFGREWHQLAVNAGSFKLESTNRRIVGCLGVGFL